jgi:CRP-like cAMP-binding protein
MPSWHVVKGGNKMAVAAGYIRRPVASVDDLAGVALFESLNDAELQELAPWFEERTASAGRLLVGEGASGYSFFILVEGSAVATAGDTTLRNLGPGDFFGEIAILERRRRSATVTTTTPAKLLVLFGTEFRQLQEAHPHIAARIEDAMRQRLSTDG